MIIHCKTHKQIDRKVDQINIGTQILAFLTDLKKHAILLERKNEGWEWNAKVKSVVKSNSDVTHFISLILSYAGTSVDVTVNTTNLMKSFSAKERNNIFDNLEFKVKINNSEVHLKKNGTGSIKIHNTKDTTGVSLHIDDNKRSRFDWFLKFKLPRELTLQVNVGNKEFGITGKIDVIKLKNKAGKSPSLSLKICREVETGKLKTVVEVKFFKYLEIKLDAPDFKLKITLLGMISITFDLNNLLLKELKEFKPKPYNLIELNFDIKSILDNQTISGHYAEFGGLTQ